MTTFARRGARGLAPASCWLESPESWEPRGGEGAKGREVPDVGSSLACPSSIGVKVVGCSDVNRESTKTSALRTGSYRMEDVGQRM